MTNTKLLNFVSQILVLINRNLEAQNSTQKLKMTGILIINYYNQKHNILVVNMQKQIPPQNGIHIHSITLIMAFVYRSEKLNYNTRSEKKQTQPNYQRGNGRDILSEIVVDMFPKKKEQKKQWQSDDRSNEQKNADLQNIAIGVEKADEIQLSKQLEEALLIKKQNNSSFFKSSTKRSFLGEFPPQNDIEPQETGSPLLKVSGKSYSKEAELQQSTIVKTHENQSTLINQQKLRISNISNVECGVSQFEKILYSQQYNLNSFMNTFDLKQELLEQVLGIDKINEWNRCKGYDFSKSKVKREVFVPKQTYQSKGTGQDMKLPQKKNRGKLSMSTRKNANQSKLMTASTMNTKIWGDQSEQQDSEEQYYLNTTPGPGYYSDSKPNIFLRSNANHVFKSKQPKLDKNKNQLLGPCTYNYNYSSFCSKGSYVSRCQRFQKTANKGYDAEIGMYNPRIGMENALLKKILRDPVSNFGGNSIRFLKQSSKKDVPGPGDYDIKRYLEGDKDIKETLNFQIQQQSNSKTINRNQIGKDKQNFPGPGYYNISTLFQHKKNEFQQLYKNAPPFGSSSPRCIPSCEQQQQCCLAADQLQTNYFKKPVQKQILSCFKPFNAGSQRFSKLRKEQKPEVGQYYNREYQQKLWNKKSFNMIFS